jgi:hypothetical protein
MWKTGAETDAHIWPEIPSCSAVRHGRKLRKCGKTGSVTPWLLDWTFAGNEVCDKLAAIGLLFSMIIYLTQEFHLNQVAALNILTISNGTCYLTPIIGGYIADAYLGRYLTLIISSFINLVVSLLPPPSLPVPLLYTL